jgi:hypothetical protein
MGLKRVHGFEIYGLARSEFIQVRVKRVFFLKIEFDPWKVLLLPLERAGLDLWESDKDQIF